MSYAELHCISNFTFLRGASHPHELVKRASDLNYNALAITDECSLAGVVKAHVAAIDHDLKLIIGSEFNLDGHKLIALAPNRQAYSELSALITLARRRGDKGSYQLDWNDLKGNLRNALIIWIPSQQLAAKAGSGSVSPTYSAVTTPATITTTEISPPCGSCPWSPAVTCICTAASDNHCKTP